MIDYHVHTPLCGHAAGKIIDYVARAREIGLIEIGFADHLPLLHKEDSTLTMSFDDLPRYERAVDEARRAFPDIAVKIGIEADYVPGYEERLAKILENYEFDFVIGSIHFLDGWGFDDERYIGGYSGRDIDELFERYFDELGRAVSTGLFDVVGHADLIKKFGYRPKTDPRRFYEKVIPLIAEAAVCVEINTGGLRKPVGEIYPAEEFIWLCREADIPVTIGSDAHSPDEVGAHIDQAIASLLNAGYREISIFTGRQREALQFKY